jgi:cardiolipin synthase
MMSRIGGKPSDPDRNTGGPTAVIPGWLPNAISVLRIALIPVWVLAAEACLAADLRGEADLVERYRLLTVVTLLSIGVSDVLDGFLARKFGLTSRMGATLDAIADKLAQVALLLFFGVRGAAAFGMVPIWFLAWIIGRDLLLGVGWLLLKRRLGVVRVVHRFHGKAASVLLFVLLIALTMGAGLPWTAPLVWVISLLVGVSTALYVRDGFRQLPGPQRRPPKPPVP